MRIQAWAPGHATLIFAVPESTDDPQGKGSLGIGLNFKTGVLTAIKQSDTNVVKWNSQEIDGKVTLTALNHYLELTGEKQTFEINHYSELKIGHGLSTSGAGALGTVICLNEYFHHSKPMLELYQIAHYADVVNHTGLGSVMGQITGGIELRTKQGGPGIGETVSIADNSQIIILMMDKLRTSDVLTSEAQMELVNSAGKEYLSTILNKTDSVTLDDIILTGKNFTRKCGLMTERVRKTLEDLEEMGESITSMAMIGETVLIKPKDGEKILEYSQRHRIDTVVTEITSELPRLLDIEH